MAPTRSSLLAAALLLLVACGPTEKPKTIAPAAPTPPVANRPTGPDWSALAAKIPNKALADQALAKLREASAAKAGGDLDKAADLYGEAGDMYDELKAAVDKIHKDLWNHQFKNFQREWDQLGKGLNRIGYRGR